VDATVERFGRIDVLINAVGGGAGTALYPAEEYPEAEWDRIVDLNLRTTLLPSQAAVRAMIAGGRGGRILNVSSVRGQLGIDAGFSAYVAAKGALNALTRQHATEWAKHGITVNAIAPTVFRSDLTAWMYAEEGRGKAVREAMLARIPLGRLGEPDDFVGPLLFLLSPASAFVTGQIVYVDGGYTAG
jgi:gluconate 5-dehydrogenase